MNNKVLLYSTGHYIQYPVINHNESKYENIYVCIYIYVCVYIYIYIYIYLDHFAVHQKITHCKSTILDI